MSKPVPGMFVLSVCVIAITGLASLGIATGGGWHGRNVAERATAVHASNPQQSARVLASMGTLPLAFEANQGQTDHEVKYMARGNGYTVFLTATDAVFALHSSSSSAVSRNGTPATIQTGQTKDHSSAIHLRLVGGNPHSDITAGNELPGRSNYFIGNDRSRWLTNVPQYARVSYREAYPGVSLAYYGLQRQLEFDFIVAPGANPAPIRLGISGAQRVATDDSGNLILASSAGNVFLHRPIAYQEKDGSRRPVDARFVLQAHNQVSFTLGNYDRSRELVIDPSVSYATFLGGTAEDDGNAIAVDANGNAYVTGQTMSNPFPGTTKGYVGGFDVFVTKISSDGRTLDYSTYVGGLGDDSGTAIALDPSGNAFVAGGTSSMNFPTTTGAYQKSFQGGNKDAFVFELSSLGSSLVYCTYLGGSATDVASGIALATDNSGDVFVAGSTTSTPFPTGHTGTIQGTSAGGFVTKMNASGSGLVYSTYIGADPLDFASAVAVDASGNAYVTGGTKSANFPARPAGPAGVVQSTCGSCSNGFYDAFVSVINPSGSDFVYSTFLGGELDDEGRGIAVDSLGDAYVTGFTSSKGFPLGVARLQQSLKGAQDAFVSELNPTGTQLLNSTYLGGRGTDSGLAIAVDKNQNAYVTGMTGSTDFPTANPTQPNNNGQNDAFVTEFSTGGSSLVFSTYLGGSLNENTSTSSGFGSLAGIAVDNAGANIYVTGSTASSAAPSPFPTTSGSYQTSFGGGVSDAFVVKYLSASPFTIANGALTPTSGHAGTSASATITVTSQNGFAGAVALACTVAPAVSKGPTCTLSNPSVTLAANGSANSTLNLGTTTASSRFELAPNQRPSGILYATLLPLGITLLGAGFGSAGSRPRKLFGFLMLGLLLATLLLLPACGSSSSSGGGGGTPTGTYTITVTGTSGSAAVTGSPALSFTVN